MAYTTVVCRLGQPRGDTGGPAISPDVQVGLWGINGLYALLRVCRTIATGLENVNLAVYWIEAASVLGVLLEEGEPCEHSGSTGMTTN